MRQFWLLTALALTTFILKAADPAPFEFKDGDRVALVGSTFFERDVSYGYLETLLTSRLADKNITFRNLGWAGDTVRCQARIGNPASPHDGFKRLSEQIAELKPTVALVCYGMSESFEGESGFAEFSNNYQKLLDMLASGGARIVIISPNKHEKLPAPLPDPEEHNKGLQLYTAEMKKIAEKKSYRFVDLFGALDVTGLTEDGINFNEKGFQASAKTIAQQLGLLDKTPDFAGLEKLRQTIIEKNILFFHRWRPQNSTYIFGFRKKEQGRNAVEIPQFDPLIADKEKEIAKLRMTEGKK